jgi:hypothetical protein
VKVVEMALPGSSETPRTLALRKTVEETHPEKVLGWPNPTEEDFALFGRITNCYSAFDFILRCMAAKSG